VAYVLERDGEVALVRRPPRGLLGGMLALPTSDWRAKPWSDAEAIDAAPVRSDWHDAGSIEHVFTHFALTLAVRRARSSRKLDGVIWSPREDLQALPSVFLKAARAAL
jgi:A/G-specific adenine glycosylase